MTSATRTAGRVLGLEREQGNALFRAGLGPERIVGWLRGIEGWFGAARRPLESCPHNADLCLAPEAENLVAKRLVPGTGRERLVSLGILRSRAERSFLLGIEFEQAGLATPRVLASLEPRSAGASHAFLLAERVAGRGPWQALDEGLERDALARALGHAVAALHAAGFRHRDLKAPNLYVERGPHRERRPDAGGELRPDAGGELRPDAGGELRIGFFDLEAARRRPEPRPGIVARDLARLAASFLSEPARAAGIEPADWRTCVAAYLERRPGGPTLDRLVAETSGWARSKRRRNLRLGRRLA